jgi:hypothetical protein
MNIENEMVNKKDIRMGKTNIFYEFRNFQSSSDTG